MSPVSWWRAHVTIPVSCALLSWRTAREEFRATEAEQLARADEGYL